MITTKQLLAAASLVGVVAASAMTTAAIQMRQDPRPQWPLRDSQGRLRLATQESGDAFALILYDTKARPRIALRTDVSDRVGIAIMDETGADCGFFGEADNGNWAVGVGHRAGLVSRLVSEPLGSGGLAIETNDGTQIAKLGSSRSADETFLEIGPPSHPTENRARLWSRRGESSGLSFEEKTERVAGLARSNKASMLWLGESPLNGSRVGDGLRVSYSPEVGAGIALRAPEARSVEIATSKSTGSGIGIGELGNMAKLGVSATGQPKLRLMGSEGQVLELVPK